MVYGESSSSNNNPLAELRLPPGFRFYPTDEELFVQYLCRKVAGHQFSLQLIAEIDLYLFDPWVLPSKAIFGEKEWYFFSPRDRKYPNRSRPNRVAGSGFWKATGTDKIITSEGRKVGIKKALVFYVGKAPKGTKTNWIMHEYRLTESTRKIGSSKLDEWVLCRIYKKTSGATKPTQSTDQSTDVSTSTTSSSHLDDTSVLLPNTSSDVSPMNTSHNNNYVGQHQHDKVLSYPKQYGSGDFDWAVLSRFGSGSFPEFGSQSGQLMKGGNDETNELPGLLPMDSVMGNNFVEDEVQSGTRTQVTQRIGRNYNSNLINQSYVNSVNPFEIYCSTRPTEYGHRL